MYKLQEPSIEWSLLHLMNFYDSDFYPRLFEFEALKRNWSNVKKYLLDLDLEKYAPQNPVISLAPKPNGNYRVVHQLDPVDSLIYTAVLYECAMKIEGFRIPERRNIACSYRIKLDLNGSFFEKENIGYEKFIETAEELSEEFEDGYVLVCDIADFYNQIYLHRVNNILSEAGSKANTVVENFLSGLNANISRGIPVGPAPSILVAEAIMADIDKKILSTTSSFTRYVDDIYIFFETHTEASIFLHELTEYLYSNHRLVFSSEKTMIIPIKKFKAEYIKAEERTEKASIHAKLEELDSGYYSEPEEVATFEELEEKDKLKLPGEVYEELFIKALKLDYLDLGLMRHILRQAGRYKIRKIVPLIFKHFDKLLPAIREVVIYFDRVLTEKTVVKYEKQFEAILDNDFLELPYINMWIFTLFQNENFNFTGIKIDYKKIHRVREAALIARRENNTTWFKGIKTKVDTLVPWDKRAVLYSSIIISKDELVHWLGLENSKGNLLNSSIGSMIIADKKASA